MIAATNGAAVKTGTNNNNINILLLADLGALRAPLPVRTSDRWSRTNPNFAQTQTSDKPKVRTNLNFEQTQTSNKPESLWP